MMWTFIKGRLGFEGSSVIKQMRELEQWALHIFKANVTPTPSLNPKP